MGPGRHWADAPHGWRRSVAAGCPAWLASASGGVACQPPGTPVPRGARRRRVESKVFGAANDVCLQELAETVWQVVRRRLPFMEAYR